MPSRGVPFCAFWLVSCDQVIAAVQVEELLSGGVSEGGV